MSARASHDRRWGVEKVAGLQSGIVALLLEGGACYEREVRKGISASWLLPALSASAMEAILWASLLLLDSLPHHFCLEPADQARTGTSGHLLSVVGCQALWVSQKKVTNTNASEAKLRHAGTLIPLVQNSIQDLWWQAEQWPLKMSILCYWNVRLWGKEKFSLQTEWRWLIS